MRNAGGFRCAAAVAAVAIAAVLGISAAGAQQLSVRALPASATAAAPVNVAPHDSTKTVHRSPTETKSAPRAKGRYYVDFRARTAASYGHAFVWYGRTDQREVEVAGLHPASESVIPYVLGHVLPVPAETGASYGDLDEQYLTANYRVYLSEADAQKVFAYIKHLQASRPLWNAAVYNCVAFIRDIAQFMGLKTPASHLLYPDDWINELRELNGGRQTVQLTAAE